MLNTGDFSVNTSSIREKISKSIDQSNAWVWSSRVMIGFGFLSFAIVYIWAIICYISSKPFTFPEYFFPATCGIAYVFMHVKKHHEEKLSYLQPKLNRIDHWEQHAERANEILDENQDFIFYLRDFKGGATHTSDIPNYVGSGASGVPNPVTWTGRYGKESTSKFLNHFAREFPIICLYNQTEKADIGDQSIILYPTDQYWFELFMNLLQKSTLVIMDYGEISTPNIELEIKAAIELNQKKIILPNWDETHKTLFFEKYPEVTPIVLSYF